MNKHHYTYEFRIYPTKDQEILLNKHFGSARFIFNHFLNKRNQFYLDNKENEKKTLTYYDTNKALTQLKKEKDYVWLKEINSQSLQYALKQLDTSYNRFFRKISKFPNFKTKSSKQSFNVPQNFKIENNKLYVPKFREGIKIKLHREIEGEICFITIKKNSSVKYFACITVEREIEELPKNNNTVGIDLGIKDFIVDSNGSKVDNPKFYRQNKKKLAYEQRQLSKKRKGSNNRNKQKINVAKVHEKISNRRKDFLHKISSKLINENQVICLESLQVKNLIKNHNLALSISDASWGTFVSMLEYKADWYSRTISKIDRFYPSSKLCNKCGYINEELVLKNREWECESCNTIHDRDINAARNILRQGLNLVVGSGTDSTEKHGEASTLVESMNHETQLLEVK